MNDDDIDRFDDPEVRRDLRIIRLALDIRTEIATSPFAKLVLAEAEAEAVAAMQAIIEADAEDPGRIRALQNVIARNQSIGRWLAELLERAREIETRLNS